MKKVVLLVLLSFFVATVSPLFANGQREASGSEDNVLSISWFEGGYGREYLDYAVEIFKEKYPEYEVKLDVGPKNHEQLRVQFIAGNPPDIFLANEGFLDYFALINDEQLLPLNDILETPAPDRDGTFKDMFLPGTLNTGKRDGNYYLSPVFSTFFGLWYSESLFEKNNWIIPKTYKEFYEVSDQIKDSGKMAAYTYQGLYPQYPLGSLLIPLIGAHGGIEALEALDKLEPGAWKSEAVLKAVRDLKEHYNKYAMNGTLALNHTQAQMEFINERAAIIPCGTWLENEMKGNWPENFDLKFMVPPVAQEKGEDNYVVMGYMFVAVPKEAANPTAAKDFLKILYSKKVLANMAKTGGVTMPIKNSTEGIDNLLPQVLVEANQELSQKNIQTYFISWRLWYKPLFKKVMDSITEMVSGKITPEEFCEDVEKEAERTRRAPEIIKY